MSSGLPMDDDDLALSNFYEVVQFIDQATCRQKYWRFYGPAIRRLAELVLERDANGLSDAAVEWTEWADGKRLVFEAELAKIGPRPPRRDECPQCEVVGVMHRCVFCGWASEEGPI